MSLRENQQPTACSVVNEFVDLGGCGIDKLIRSYDESASAIAPFENRARLIFQLTSQEKDRSWLDCCFIGMYIKAVCFNQC